MYVPHARDRAVQSPCLTQSTAGFSYSLGSTADDPAAVVLTSSLGSGKVTAPVIPITATFDSAVTGVTVSDFNGGAPFPVEAGVTYAVSGSGTEWVLTVTVDDTARVDKTWAFSVAAASGSISPSNSASSDTFDVSYEPPTATFSSDAGPSGTEVNGLELKYTATFDSAVTGVAVADFGLTSSAGGLTYTAAVATTDNINWVLTATVTGGYTDSTLAVTMPANSGSIVDKNAVATNNGFSLDCELYPQSLVAQRPPLTAPAYCTSVAVTVSVQIIRPSRRCHPRQALAPHPTTSSLSQPRSTLLSVASRPPTSTAALTSPWRLACHTRSLVAQRNGC